MVVAITVLMILLLVGVVFIVDEGWGLWVVGLIMLSIPVQWHMQNKCESAWWTSGRPEQIANTKDFHRYAYIASAELDQCLGKHPYPWDIFKHTEWLG